VKVRPPTQADFSAVLDLVTAADVAVVGESDWTEDALRAEWHQLDLEHDAWLIEFGSRVAAYAAYDDRGGGRLIADGYVHPDLRERGLGSRLIDITEEHARNSIPRQPAGLRIYLQNPTLVGDDCTPNLYARRGYAPAEHQFRMVRELDAPPKVRAPAGIEIRLYREPVERRAVHTVIQEAFATEPRSRRRTFEEWAPRVFERLGFDPTLVWVARDGHELVGANVCSWKDGGDWGWIGMLGVLPSHRGRGIGEALLRTAFAEFWHRGERRVALGVVADNAIATRLYERAGMHVLYTIVVYEKELRAAQDG
jgi:mycothiol synthase